MVHKLLLLISLAALALVLACTEAEFTPTPSPTPAPSATPTATAAATPTPTATPTSAPKKASSITEVVLPHDEASHQSLFEWWYFNGHVQASDGSRYGYHFVFFETFSPALDTYLLLGQLGVTDHERGAFVFGQSVGSRTEAPDSGLDITAGDWRMSGSGGNFKLTASLEEYHLELELSTLKPAVIHGQDGFVEYGDMGGSYYYSYPRIGTIGTIADHGTPVEVKGLSWMDHQWGDLLVSDVGWDWFSIQLDDGTDVMYYNIRDVNGIQLASFGTVVEEDGISTQLTSDDVTVQALGSWVSPRTNAKYPMGWQISIPSLGLSFNLSPVLLDAEFHILGSVLPTYWEGEVIADGESAGKPVKGFGFAELVGYTRR